MLQWILPYTRIYSTSCVALTHQSKYLSGSIASDHASESNCKICQYSRYSYHGYGSCTWCNAGRFINDNAVNVNAQAIAALRHLCWRSVSDIFFGHGCLLCAGGEYISDDATNDLHVAESSCLICQYSKYTPSPTGNRNHLCPAMKNINDHVNNAAYHDQSSDCKTCPAGRYRETNVQHTCKYCPAGTYNSDNATNAVYHDAHTDCKVCLSGKYTGSNGASSCQDCPRGRARAVHSYDGTEWTYSNNGVADTLADCYICQQSRYTRCKWSYWL